MAGLGPRFADVRAGTTRIGYNKEKGTHLGYPYIICVCVLRIGLKSLRIVFKAPNSLVERRKGVGWNNFPSIYCFAPSRAVSVVFYISEGTSGRFSFPNSGDQIIPDKIYIIIILPQLYYKGYNLPVKYYLLQNFETQK